MWTVLLDKINSSSLWRQTLPVWGFRVRASSLDRLTYLLLHRLGLMGQSERHFLKSRVQPGMVVVDVGANLGLYTLLLARLTGPQGQVFSFEPEPTLFAALQYNGRTNGVHQVRCFPLALGSHSGRVALFRSLFNWGDNRLGRLPLGKGSIEVELARLDDCLPTHRIDFLKMDVQGFELGVLQGMSHILEESPHLEIYVEFWPHGLRRAGTDPEGFLEYLNQRGFRLFHVEEKNLVEIRQFPQFVARFPDPSFTNLLATRRKV